MNKTYSPLEPDEQDIARVKVDRIINDMLHHTKMVAEHERQLLNLREELHSIVFPK